MFFNLIFFNRYFDKNRLKALILWSLTKSGEKNTLDLVEKLKNLGFEYATKAGLSLGIDDLQIPPTKAELILDAEINVELSKKDFAIGNVTIIEKFQQLIDIWHRTSEILKQNVIEHFRSTDILNPVYMMAFSGARGNISQVRQLVGMRGLMADPQGQILDFPIRSNFREGLTLTEYVISCYGARKGLVDTALRTANSGYLTRRLVDVAQHIIVRQLDCGTTNGIFITDMKDGTKILFSLQKRLIGRVLAQTIDNVARRNQDITPLLALQLSKVTNEVFVRSPLRCEAKNSICQLCYGWSLAHGSLVSLGEAVGILAAQSIGEPGTQLTMRTFHTGGVFSGDVMQEIRAPFEGIVGFSRPLQGILIRTLHGKVAFLTKIDGELVLSDSKSLKNIKYTIPPSTVLFIRCFEKVIEKQLLAEYSSVVTTNSQGIQANYNLNSPSEGQVYFENVLLVVKSGKEGELSKTALKFGSIWILSGKLYQSSIRSQLFIKSNDLVDQNSILNESLLVSPFTSSVDNYFDKNISYQFFKKKSKLVIEEKSYLNQLVTSKKANIGKTSIVSNFEKKSYFENKLHINQNFLEWKFKKIRYKRFGYFINVDTLTRNQFFFPTSLKNNNIFLNKVVLQWFSQQTGNDYNILIFDKNFGNQQKGQFFLIPQTCYKIFTKKLIHTSLLEPRSIIKHDNELFVLKNKQGNKIKVSSKNQGILVFQESLFNKKENHVPILAKKHTFYCKKNPSSYLQLHINSEKIASVKKQVSTIYSIPYDSAINKQKMRKNKFNKKNYSNPFLSLNTNKANSHFFNFEKTTNNISAQEKKDFFMLELKIGWFFLPSNLSTIFYLNKKLFTPTSQINSYKFDQHYIYKDIITWQKKLYTFSQTTNFTKIRYIKNKYFRYNKLHYYKQTSFSLVNNLPTTKEIRFLHSTNQIKDIGNSLLTIFRHPVYKKQCIFNPLFLIQIQKSQEIKQCNLVEQKKRLQKIIKNDKKITFYQTTSFLCNKQKITTLKLPNPSIDLQLQKNRVISNTQSTLFFSKPINIGFNAQNSISSRTCNLKIQFNQRVLFFISHKVESLNDVSNETNPLVKNKSKVLVTGTNTVLEQNSFSLNSFFSPFQGEITTIKTNLVGKEKSLLLTNSDKISFSNNQTNLLIKIGQLVRYGDKLFNNIATTESGQIIQIDKNRITLRKARPILFSSQGVFHVDNGDIIEKNSPLITLFYKKLKTEDIVQGIPKIEELFEARQTKEGELLQENLHTKLTTFFNLYKQHYTPQKAARKSIEKIQQILVSNVQKVYQSQGVSIADKHIEIIVRQMTTKVKITESGRTGLLRGELVDLEWVELINLGIEAQNKLTEQGIEVEKAEYEPIILGITKAALETESFISAASFQETTRILSRAAIDRKTDFLRGLKENVILGHLIPAGTGFRLFFESEIKESTNLQKISLLSYKDVIKKFSYISTKK